jgi:hypothetical protein
MRWLRVWGQDGGVGPTALSEAVVDQSARIHGLGDRCGACSQKAQCTSGRYKYLAIHIYEAARQRARELANTPEFSQAQRQRKKVEALFAQLKNQIGVRRLRLRRMKFVRASSSS